MRLIAQIAAYVTLLFAQATCGQDSLQASFAIRHLRFSPDGRYAVAQDDSSISVLTVEPLAVLFSVPARSATLAEFSPDSHYITFATQVSQIDSGRIALVATSAHVERWSVPDGTRSVSGAVGILNCLSLQLSLDGRTIACVDFTGKLRVLDVQSGVTLFEREHCTTQVCLTCCPFMDGKCVSVTLGPARMDLSTDGRYFVVLPWGGRGLPVVRDLKENSQVEVAGILKKLKNVKFPAGRQFSFVFVAPDRLLVSIGYPKSGLVDAWVAALPSGGLVRQTKVPSGPLLRAADPGFVLIRPFGEFRIGHAPPTRAAAVELETGRVIISDAPALDVLGRYYITERRGGEVALYETGKRLVASLLVHGK